MSKPIHVICGKCGCDDEFTYSISRDDGELSIDAHCGNCGELTGLAYLPEDEVLKHE